MPFLWKKESRVARISQRFVADLQCPRKHGGSLVVETGFPTSLVDLVVKNKNRLKKPSSKRKQDNDQDCWEISDPVLTSPLPPHLVCPEACADLVEFESRGGSSSEGGIEVAEEEDVRKCEAVDVVESGEDGGSDRNGMFVNVLRVFVVLVLCLSSRRFTVSITMSAVLLLLLELVGKWVFGPVVPCSDVRARFERLIDRVHDSFGFLLLREKKCEKGKSSDSAGDGVTLRGETVVEGDVDFRDCSLTDETGETDEAVHAGKELIISADPSSVDHEIRGDSLDALVRMRYTGLKKDEYIDFVSDRKHDQNAKPRSKFMQRIVPKKLKHLKAGGKRNTVSIAAPCEVRQVTEDNYGKVEDEVQAPLVKDWLGKLSGDKETNGEKMTSEDDGKSITNVLVVTKPVDGGRERKQRMALMITFAMILAALIGGRFLAVMLTTGYFGSKFIGAVMT